MNSVQVKIEYPERLSRGILLLKTFLGWLILIPHCICLGFLVFVASFVIIISWFAVLFTGKYPKSLFNYMVGLQNWGIRIGAYYYLLRDEYPGFGFESSYPASFKVTYPEKLSRGILLLRTFFGWIYVGIPHVFCLYFRLIGLMFVLFVAWWAILFTGKIPKSMFSYISGTFRWSCNFGAYLMFLTDEYPPFTGKEVSGAASKGVTA
jgi:hypothetical protein